MIHFRAYNKIDEAGVMNLLEELRGSKDVAGFSTYLMDSETYKQSYLKSKSYIVLVALLDDVLAGFIIAEHYTNDIANLVMLYVGKKFRRKGIGFNLKQTLEVFCTSQGYKKMVSQVRTNNTTSIMLNKKAGWKQEIDKIYPDYYYWVTIVMQSALSLQLLKH